MYGERHGMFVGFLCGLLMDVFYGSVLGFYALLFLYIGACNGLFHRVFYQDDLKLPLALITGSDIVYSLLCYILLFLLRGRFAFGFYVKNVIFPELVYTIFVTIFLYPIILFINKDYLLFLFWICDRTVILFLRRFIFTKKDNTSNIAT